jgi:hypothetical protein
MAYWNLNLVLLSQTCTFVHSGLGWLGCRITSWCFHWWPASERPFTAPHRRSARFTDTTNLSCYLSSAADPPELQETNCFDAIHVGASLTELPRNFVQLLRPGGRLVAPLGAMHGAAPQVNTQLLLP